MKNNRYFLYLRKSTDREDMQVLSIEGQRTACESFAASANIMIVETFVEHQSAKAPGRPIFNAMLKGIANGEADGIIAYHPNRLARNSKDGGELIYWLDTNQIKDLRFPTFWFANDPQGKAMLGIEFAQSKRYSDDLAIVTKRGLLQKCLNGEYPGPAPRGYVNDKNTKVIKIDPQLAPLIKQAYEDYASGHETIESLRIKLADKGIITKRTKLFSGEKPLDPETMRKLLSNPIYYGSFRYDGVLYEGKHEAIVSKQLFNEVQRILNLRVPTKRISAGDRKLPKPYTKLFKCRQCGYGITAETQKGFTYYRCTRKSPDVECRAPFVREEAVEDMLCEQLSKFVIPENDLIAMEKLLEQDEQTLKRNRSDSVREIQSRIKEVATRLELLADTYLNQEIDRLTYVKKQNELVSLKATFNLELKKAEGGNFSWVERLRKWILTAKTLDKITKNGTPEEKRRVAVEIFGSNLRLDHQNLSGKAVFPWFLAPQFHSYSTHVPFYEVIRTQSEAEMKGFEPGKLPTIRCTR